MSLVGTVYPVQEFYLVKNFLNILGNSFNFKMLKNIEIKTNT